MTEKHKSAGVYITEQNAFPNSVVSVPTAVPAFVGYTPQAEYQGKSYLNVPVKITSWNEFLAIFCFPQKARGKQQQYSPNYFVTDENVSQADPNSISFANRNFSIYPDPSTIYYLYLSVLIFYQNGGGDAYIVSVGGYGKATGRPLGAKDPLINPNVSLKELLQGLYLLKKESEPTTYVFPESTLLSSDHNATLTQAMLLQCEELGTAMSLLDVPGGRSPDQDNYEQAIEDFRASTGSNGLSYGAAYFPFVNTTVLQTEDLNYTNFFGGDLDQLAEIINPKNSDPSLTSIFEMIKDIHNQSISVNQLNNALLNTSKLYSTISATALELANLLPPSGGMAGVITLNDNAKGVWKSPANVSINSVKDLPIQLNNEQQGPLNQDLGSGKSVNVIRSFIGEGVLVWGARTMDGNSADYQYIAVRRTLIFLEQSCKLAIESYVFQSNDASTWIAVKSMLSSFLTSIWKEGGLAGASPQDAYNVECGLGTTMTSQDILDGYMNASVRVAITHPADFIVLTFRQKMASSS
jgi:phage tail sheath protein FI